MSAMSGKYNLFNLLGSEPEAKLKSILASVDIDYQQHFPKGTHAESKEAALANILSSVQTAKKLILFRTLISSNFALDQNIIKEQNIEKNFEQIRVISIITKKILNTLLEEAISTYQNEEQLKLIRLVMSELRHQYEKEQDQRLKSIYANEIQRILMDEMMQNNLKRLNQSYQDRIQKLDEDIKSKNDLITGIRELKKSTLDESSARVGQELANHTALDSDIVVYRDIIPEEERDAFLRDFALEYYRAEKEQLYKYIQLDDKDQSRINRINKDEGDNAHQKMKIPTFINYELARTKNKSIRELAKREPDFEEIYRKLAAKRGYNLDRLTPEQIRAEAHLLAEKFESTVTKMIDGKKEKIVLHAECREIEADKQKEKNNLEGLYSKLDLPPTSEFKKTPAALEFDDFLATVSLPSKSAKATRG